MKLKEALENDSVVTNYMEDLAGKILLQKYGADYEIGTLQDAKNLINKILHNL